MIPRVRETNRKAGVSYAIDDDGLELPVIDITHPAFEINFNPSELAAISEATLRGMQKLQRVPRFIRKWLTRGSILTRDQANPIVGGMTTYLMKLGPTNLGRGYASAMDLKVAGSIAPVCVRLRLRDIAHLIADELRPILQTRMNTPLHLLNIAGGAASDSVNALLLIHKDDPKLLKGRRIVIHILDIARSGANFAARALEALKSEGAPLHGIAAESRFVEYNWCDVTGMQPIWKEIAGDTVVAGSSEGGLFEYGSDEQILANLKALYELSPSDFVMSGSVLHDENSVDANLRVLMKSSALAIHSLGIARLSTISQSAGWTVARVVEGNPMYQVFSLRKARV